MARQRYKKPPFSRRFFPDNLGVFPRFHHKWRYLRVKRIPKPNGKTRKILVPHGKLKEAQLTALKYLSEKVQGRYPIDLLNCQTAYKRGSSAYKNAKIHQNYEVSVKFDLKSCFDTIPQNSHAAHRAYRRYSRKFFRGRKMGKSTRKYHAAARTVSIEEALYNEGIPQDISRWIADVATFDGFLYQGSPLSPLLCNIVTKQLLCRRMLKLATVYHMPIFQMDDGSKNPWFFVIPHDLSKDNTLYVYGLQSHKDNLMLKAVAEKLSVSFNTWLKNPISGSITVEDMVPRAGEPTPKMLLRYGQKAWQPRKPMHVRKLIEYLQQHPTLKVPPGQKHGPVTHHPLGKTVFTLYADDGVFSSNNRKLPQLRFILKNVIRDSGFRPNTKKGIRVMRGCRRFVTGFEVSKVPKNSPEGSRGVRMPWPERDKRYRRKLHHMKIGKIPITEENVRSFCGSLEYLRRPNPRAWAKFAKTFYNLVVTNTTDANITNLVARFKGL
jgi:hypothetical protein